MLPYYFLLLKTADFGRQVIVKRAKFVHLADHKSDLFSSSFYARVRVKTSQTKVI
jgi:hypothetical protein